MRVHIELFTDSEENKEMRFLAEYKPPNSDFTKYAILIIEDFTWFPSNAQLDELCDLLNARREEHKMRIAEIEEIANESA